VQKREGFKKEKKNLIKRREKEMKKIKVRKPHSRKVQYLSRDADQPVRVESIDERGGGR